MFKAHAPSRMSCARSILRPWRNTLTFNFIFILNIRALDQFSTVKRLNALLVGTQCAFEPNGNDFLFVLKSVHVAGT